MRKLLTALIAAAFAVTSVNPASAETTWLPLSSAGQGEGIIAIKELDHNSVSSRFAQPLDAQNTNDARICAEGFGAAPCDFKSGKKNFYANQVLPLCKTATDENCVVGLRTAGVDGVLAQAELVREVEIGTYEYEDLEKGLFKSGKPAIFKSSNATAPDGTTEYVVSANVRIHFDSKLGKYITSELEASVIPVKEISGNYEAVGLFEGTQCGKDDADGICIFGWGPAKTCGWQEKGKCGQEVAFNPETRFEIEVRVPKTVAGWFRGRIQKPDISITSFSANNNTVKVSALPASVARMEAKITAENTTEAQRAIANRGGTTGGSPVEGCKLERLLCGNIAKGMSAMRPESIKWVDAFRKASNDTAVATTTLWNFNTFDVNSYNGNRCLTDTSKVMGIVTTNATALEGTPPGFKGGYLTYNVAGLHYAPNGTDLNLGTYDLVMRSDVARCLYGFSKAPLTATVSVVNEKGTKTTATTVVSEKNGWLKMAAYGFTFSKKTIKVKIAKKKK